MFQPSLCQLRDLLDYTVFGVREAQDEFRCKVCQRVEGAFGGVLAVEVVELLRTDSPAPVQVELLFRLGGHQFQCACVVRLFYEPLDGYADRAETLDAVVDHVACEVGDAQGSWRVAGFAGRLLRNLC